MKKFTLKTYLDAEGKNEHQIYITSDCTVIYKKIPDHYKFKVRYLIT